MEELAYKVMEMEIEKEDGRYLDALSETSGPEDGKNRDGGAPASKKDKLITALLGVLCVAALGYLLVTLHTLGSLKNSLPEADPSGEEETTSPFFDVSAVNAGLTPTLKGVKFPAGMSDGFIRLYSANEDVVGWIRIADTCIDYPLVQGEDNDYYERRNYYREHDERGSVWLDYRNRFGPGAGELDNVTVIWGHNFSEHDLSFYEVEKYLDVDYYKTHPLIETQNLYGETYKWKVFGCIIAAVEEPDDNGQIFYYWNTQLATAELPGFTDEIYRRSWFRNPAVDVLPGDKLICLSTCTYMLNTDKYHEIRCVLFGRLVREGEDETVDVSAAYAQPEPRMPQLYYDQKGIPNPYLSTPVFGF